MLALLNDGLLPDGHRVDDVDSKLCRHFPRVQFIVSTHSPFVCQSVVRDGRVDGGLFRLPPPGSTDRD